MANGSATVALGWSTGDHGHRRRTDTRGKCDSASGRLELGLRVNQSACDGRNGESVGALHEGCCNGIVLGGEGVDQDVGDVFVRDLNAYGLQFCLDRSNSINIFTDRDRRIVDKGIQLALEADSCSTVVALVNVCKGLPGLGTSAAVSDVSNLVLQPDLWQ